MNDITIPPEALEAMRAKLPPFFSESMARAALAAGLAAWPGIITKPATPDGQWTHNATIWAHIILPLTENTNVEG